MKRVKKKYRTGVRNKRGRSKGKKKVIENEKAVRVPHRDTPCPRASSSKLLTKVQVEEGQYRR